MASTVPSMLFLPKSSATISTCFSSRSSGRSGQPGRHAAVDPEDAAIRSVSLWVIGA